jgi:hypothetical protein
LTLEAAQASQEARSLGRRSLSALDEDVGAEVGDGMGGVEMGVVSTRVGAGCHCDWGV